MLFIYLFEGDGDTYHVEKLIGSGAFAKVYLANKRGDTDEDDFETDDESAVVLKVVTTVLYKCNLNANCSLLESCVDLKRTQQRS